MAINPSTNPNFTGRITAPDADYPYGSSKNESSPGAGDGTPYLKARADDVFGAQQALLVSAGIVPSGTADTATTSQYLQALVEIASGRAVNYDESGVADAYVLDVRADQQAPQSYFDGLTAYFTPGNDNTGPATANLAGLGAIDIKLPGGVDDPAAGDILAGRLERLTYRAAPTPHLELDLSGRVRLTVIAASATYTPPVGVKALRILAVGGGGGSGGVAGAGAGTGASSCAGGGGGGVESVYKGSEIASSYTVTIGAGGSAGASGNNPGTGGGTTSVVGGIANMQAVGGEGGSGRTASAGTSLAEGAQGGSASGGNLRNGAGGGSGTGGAVGGGPLAGFPGGASIFGAGGPARLGSAGGASGTVGGGGGSSSVFGTSDNFTGASGGAGRVIVEEYY